MDSEYSQIMRFTTKSRLQKAINSLLGVIDGIAIDGEINASEVEFLRLWLEDHQEIQRLHPLNELVPVVQATIADGVLTQEEREDISWLCERLCSTEYYDTITADLQRLHAIVGGIVADGRITEGELRGLSMWLADHEHLKTCWPYDEIDSLVTAVMADGKIDENEHKMLTAFFSDFVTKLDDRTVSNPPVASAGTIMGLCAVCPEIEFAGAKFCFTGASTRYTRPQLADIVRRLGGELVPSISTKVGYLVIGAEGNPCWAYACYGRKVEKAVALRKEGVRVLIIHENDFHDAVADHG